MARFLASKPAFASVLVAAAVLPYLNTLHGRWVYDDKVAVVGNPDVFRSDVPWSDLWYHDFWGNSLSGERAHGWTHHSWRPLVVATFRLDWLRGGGATESFHITNMAMHALSCLVAWFAFDALAHLAATAPGSATADTKAPADPSPGAIGFLFREMLPAHRLAALIFALHPIHSECVANVTSRADVVASIFTLAGLGVYSWSLTAVRQAGKPRSRCRLHLLRFAGWATVVLSMCLGLLCKETSLSLPMLACCIDAALGIADVAAAARTEPVQAATTPTLLPPVDVAEPHILAEPQAPVPAANKRLTWATPIASPLQRPSKSSPLPTTTRTAGEVAGKEIEAPAPVPVPESVPDHGTTSRMHGGEAAWRSTVAIATHATIAVAAYYLRIVVMARGYALHTWANPIHNTLYYVSDRFTRLASIALVQAFALSMLLIPQHLSHEHNAIRHVTSLWDARNVLTAAVWLVLLASAAYIVQQLRQLATGATSPARFGHAFRLMLGFSMIAASYFPSSHLVQYVAFILAERTLYLPSFGAAIVIAEAISTVGRGGIEAMPQPQQALVAATTAPSLEPSANLAAASLAAPRPPLAERAGRAAEATDERDGSAARTLRSTPQASVPPTATARGKGWRDRASWLAVIVLACMCIYYPVRTWHRGVEWTHEDLLMTSNLEMYPENNVMTIYGLGAVALYRGELEKAEQLLQQAANTSTMVEPHILLSQLYWKYKAGPGQNGMQLARERLMAIAASGTPRKEVLTNLGLLMYQDKNASQDPAVMKESEYYVLAAQVAHGYPAHHQAISLLDSNAGCVRLMSEPSRYGNAQLAEGLFISALKGARQGGTVAAFRNAAIFYLLQGYADQAIAIATEGMNVIHTQQSQLVEKTLEAGKEARDSVASFYIDIHAALHRIAIAAEATRAITAFWSLEAPVSGDAALERMRLLGVECYMELLWW